MHSRKRKPLTQLPADAENVNGKRRKSCLDESSPNFTKDLNVRAGSVLRMVLKNFMCHSHLEVSFNSNINYVIGRNGSGKSAILTALVVGLGGKATLTNRGSSVKGFIKNGKTSGSVEITLSNKGPLAYKHRTFGDEIIIERTFRASGGGNYKIKSKNGEVISHQAKEVQIICLSLNIQIDNPICLLNQDTSRNFLSTKDTRQKFLLFMKATRLEELLEEYKKVVSNKRSASQALKEKEASYKKLENEKQQLKNKITNHENIANLKSKVNELQKEVSWAKVRDAEVGLQKEEVVVNAVLNESTTIQNQLENEQQVLLTSNATMQTLEQQIQELNASIESQNTPQNILVRALGELKEEIVEKSRENRVVQKNIALESGNCGILEREIQQITQNFSQLEQEKIKRIEDINTMEKKIQDVESLMETSKNDQFQMINSVNRLQEEERSIRSELDQVNGQIENNKYRISSLKEQSSNTLSLYGRDMARIVETINTHKSKFNKVPRGPLGNYIKLKDKKWAVAVEGFLGPSLLRAFTVDNKSDSQILMKIFENVCTGQSKPMVITSKFFDKVHDVRNNLVQPIDGCLSVYSVLEISDPVVANCLIDQSGLESMLLIPNTDKAIELLSEKRRVPRNCKQGITITGDKYYPDPNYKTYASRYHRAQFLQVSVQDMIRQLEEQLQVLVDKKESVGNQHNSIKVEAQEQSRKLKDLQQKVTKLGAALSRLRRQCDDLKNVAEPDVANVHTMETELSELKVKIDERKVVAAKIMETIAEVRRKIDKKESKLNDLKVIVRGYEERIETLTAEFHEHVRKCKEYEVNRRFATKRLEDSNKRLCLAQNLLRQKQDLVEGYTRDASAIGDRPDVLREVNVIMNQLKQDQRMIRSIESDIEDINEVSEKHRDCKIRMKKIEEIMKIMVSDVKDLQLAIEKRSRYYQHTEDYFITFVKHSFQKVLEFRQFKGSIEINMDNKSLEMIVIPQQGSQGLTSTSNLSGGERSFSTVAFLYSLWQCMEFPFYFLDEFDVFMDKVNRSKVMEILIYHAKCRPELQFVFLTPQDVSFVNDKSIAIHKLSDPERNLTED